jgi:hypothetical protein
MEACFPIFHTKDEVDVIPVDRAIWAHTSGDRLAPADGAALVGT